MRHLIKKKINTDLKPFELFKIFREEEYPFILDSCEGYERLGQFSIIGFNPFLKIISKNGNISISGDEQQEKFDNPFKVLKKYYKKYHQTYEKELPFYGGIVGQFSYDLCHHIERLPRTAKDDVEIPDLNVGLYDGAIIYNHKTQEVFITNINDDEQKMNKIIDRIINYEADEIALDVKQFNSKPAIQSNMSKDYYLEAIDKIKEYIKNGDIYQVNMTQRFRTTLREQPIELYSKLRQINPAPFSAYLDFSTYQILSSSPERFFRIQNNTIETRPIKGTRPRGATAAEDFKYKNALKNSEKDKSELLMIVDLERNDFSKVAKTNTVRVPELFAIEKYPTVFHLVATITCELDDTYGPIDCIEASFPGGSITGAPKIRAMEIIDELEPTQRNVYTGSIGYIDFNGDLDLNIVIRTMVVKDDKIDFQVGGGIVWDSDAESEYQESLDKAKALVTTLSL